MVGNRMWGPGGVHLVVSLRPGWPASADLMVVLVSQRRQTSEAHTGVNHTAQATGHVEGHPHVSHTQQTRSLGPPEGQDKWGDEPLEGLSPPR